MRASGWVFALLILCSIPLAIGIALGQTWPSYVTFALWGVFAIAAVVRSFVRKPKRNTADAIVSAGNVYNELYLGQRRRTVTFGATEKVVAEEQLDRRDELADGVVHLEQPPHDDSRGS